VLGREPKVLMNVSTGQVFGTRRRAIKARPFLRPAFDLSYSRVLATFAKHAEAKIAREIRAAQRIQID